MSNGADNLGNLLPDEARLTKVGSIIRKASLDEIPQFYNVLIGDMSLIFLEQAVLNHLII